MCSGSVFCRGVTRVISCCFDFIAACVVLSGLRVICVVGVNEIVRIVRVVVIRVMGSLGASGTLVFL